MKSKFLLVIAILFCSAMFTSCSEEEISPQESKMSGEGNVKDDKDF
ncbi:MAG: hypothetical protein AAF901_12260 [Bacteroidota bacterium]